MLNYFDIQNDAAIERNYKRDMGTSVHGRCLLCGANIRNPERAKYVHEHLGGGYIVTEAEAEKLNAEGRESADLGAQPIGPECYRKHKSILAEYFTR